MIGILLLYFMAKPFYALAEQYYKHKWGYGLLGIVSYYVGTFIGGMILAIIFEFGFSLSVETYSDTSLGFMAAPFGILSCYLFYVYLKNRWKKKSPAIDEEILDGELIEE